YDGFILAAAGFHVHMIEANPVVAALLDDGLERARHHPSLVSVTDRIRLTTGEAQNILARRMHHPDVIYLDPMFPQRSKSALVKQELRLLQLLTAQTISSPEQLLRQALAARPRKVVVKRPRTGSALLNLRPSYTVRGKAIRFDVYVGPGTDSVHR
ncbi:MAG: class I SAM-dependent methyltransferase, partial [Desulfobulbus sp.]|nr:class I SAM-dependent methyltransferase [Desulfobulbus sp.]